MDRLILSFKDNPEGSSIRMSLDPSSSFLTSPNLKKDKEFIFVLEDEAKALYKELERVNKKLEIDKAELEQQLRNIDYEFTLLKDKSSKTIAEIERLNQMPQSLLTHGDEHYLRTAFALRVKGFVSDLKSYLGG